MNYKSLCLFFSFFYYKTCYFFLVENENLKRNDIFKTDLQKFHIEPVLINVPQWVGLSQ